MPLSRAPTRGRYSRIMGVTRKPYCNNPMANKAQPLQDDLTYKEYPISILVQAERHTHQRAIQFLKNQWSNHSKDKATWECEDHLCVEYPTLFPSTS